jgi:hypothetical protein
MVKPSTVQLSRQSRSRQERFAKVDKSNCLDTVAYWKPFHACIHKKAPLGLEIFPCVMETTLQLRRHTALDLNRPDPSTRERQDEINFRTGGCAIKARISSR